MDAEKSSWIKEDLDSIVIMTIAIVILVQVLYIACQ
jgi:hypothetical protein